MIRICLRRWFDISLGKTIFLDKYKQTNDLYYLMLSRNFTIFALSSGQGKCGVSVIRITGKDAKESILKMTKPKKLPKPRYVVLRYICHPFSDENLDKGLVIWFPGPKSFTGEDSVEFHVHGGPAVVNAVLSALGKLPNYTPAQPGEFTKRAFYNAKLDLTSVEGLSDLIHAETQAQRKQALRQMEGHLAEYYTKWKEIILQCRAHIEAYIDFSEDDNIEQGVLLDVENKLLTLSKEISSHLIDSRRGERLKSGVNLVIVGRPNVGKSSFLNLVLQRPAAIVSPIAGTTRDVLDMSLDLGGFPLNISDTAGLRTSYDLIEKEGVKRAINKAKNADIALIVIEVFELFKAVKMLKNKFNFNEFLNNYLTDVGVFQNEFLDQEYEWLTNSQYIVLINKIDLLDLRSEDYKFLQEIISTGNKMCMTSMTTNEGVEEVLLKMKDLCSNLCSSGLNVENPHLTSARHRTHIEACLKHIDNVMLENCYGEATNLLRRDETLLLAAQQLQLAANQIGHVIGQMTTEDILDCIFSTFCIGK